MAELGGKGRYYVNPGALEEGLLSLEETHYGDYEHEVDEQPSWEPEHLQERWWATDEDNSYHPYLVNQNSLAWLSESCCIGINPDLPGDSKYVTTNGQPPSSHPAQDTASFGLLTCLRAFIFDRSVDSGLPGPNSGTCAGCFGFAQTAKPIITRSKRISRDLRTSNGLVSITASHYLGTNDSVD